MSREKPNEARQVPDQVREVLAWLEEQGTQSTRDGMARYAIPSDKAFGVPVGDLRKYAKALGRNHDLAAALWETDRYEARMLVAFLGEPEKLTPQQMDRWCHDFDNWALCDTLCFHLFDRTAHAFPKVEVWAPREEEFVRRAAFALLASLASHDKKAPDEAFLRCLPLLEAAAEDDRNFVKKGVSWALRTIGRRNPALNTPATDLANRLAASPRPAPRWIGKDALKDFAKVAARKAAK